MPKEKKPVKKYAVLNDKNEVENVIECDEDFRIPGKRLVQHDKAGPGWVHKGGNVLEPPEISYEERMARWVKTMERSDNVMGRDVEDIIDVLTDEQRSALAEQTMDKYLKKKAARLEMPKKDAPAVVE